MSKARAEELALLVRAGWRVVSLESFEEDRALKLLERVAAASDRTCLPWTLGSGLGSYAETLPDAVTIPYEDIPHFPLPDQRSSQAPQQVVEQLLVAVAAQGREDQLAIGEDLLEPGDQRQHLPFSRRQIGAGWGWFGSRLDQRLSSSRVNGGPAVMGIADRPGH